MRKCIVCNKTSLRRVIELGFHPLADTFLKNEQLLFPQKFYPLNCLLCEFCGHLQNEYFVPGKERYVESNYSYTSSNSNTARAHWQELCDTVSKYARIEPSDHIIEFGSNDGYLLKQFARKGHKVTGIEPAPNIAALANKSGVKTLVGFLSRETITEATKRYGKAKLIIGNNVLNHIDDLSTALQAIKLGLTTVSLLVVEVPYLKDVIEKYLFDMLFHEHISNFSVKSIDYLFKKNSLFITHIEQIAYHGGSIRIFASPIVKDYNTHLVNKYIKAEEKTQLYSLPIYKKFMAKIKQDKFNVLTKLYSLKKRGRKIAAIGAGARSNTLLNYYKLDSEIIEFVTDASKFKIGKYTPGSCIPIKSDQELARKQIDIALITAWNIGKFLSAKIKKINDTIEFIIPGDKELL